MIFPHSAHVFCLLFSLTWAIEVEFPPWFRFGAATSSYQSEGAWNQSDKSESVWDRYTHQDPTVIADLSNGDVACDSYNLWQRDVDMAAEVGLHFYRFSIAWTRLLPTGYSNKISEDGKKYYNNLIDGLLEKGIEPIVTMYHWDLPQNLQDLGGWTNPLITKWFSSYARVVFTLFADRVKTWITINEPTIICDFAFTTGTIPPGVIEPTFAPFLCNKHVLLAHAKAWRIYDQEFKPLYHGKVSLSNHIVWFKPQARKDFTVTKLSREYVIGRYSHPIYSKEGGWPPGIMKIMRESSLKEGFESSRLPDLSREEIDLIKGTFDFYALNYYTCRLVRRAKVGEKIESFYFFGIPELRAKMEIEPGMSHSTSEYLVTCPTGLREVLAYLKEQYGNIEILITENGFSLPGMGLKDGIRSDYIQAHLEQILLSMRLDGVNVTGYTLWSLMDNFEWTEGYQSKFGLYEVDFNSEHRTRTPRLSAYYYSSIIRNHSLKVNSSLAGQFWNK